MVIIQILSLHSFRIFVSICLSIFLFGLFRSPHENNNNNSSSTLAQHWIWWDYANVINDVCWDLFPFTHIDSVESCVENGEEQQVIHIHIKWFWICFLFDSSRWFATLSCFYWLYPILCNRCWTYERGEKRKKKELLIDFLAVTVGVWQTKYFVFNRVQAIWLSSFPFCNLT